MLHLGIIGTGPIVSEMVEALNHVEGMKITCLYSRTIERAKQFAKFNNLVAVKLTTDFNDMVKEIDAVYIASPNGLHYEQARYFISHCKHVLVEKPMCFTASEVDQLQSLALANKTIVLEAFKPIYLPNYAILKKEIKKLNPAIANLQWSKYSSRMSKVKMGIFESVFDEKLGRGSIYDALIYPVELAISLFGPVTRVMSMSQMLPNNVSANDVVIMAHGNQMITSIICAKTMDSMSPSEIMGDEASISFTQLTQLANLSRHQRVDHLDFAYDAPVAQYPMAYELQYFHDLVVNSNFEAMKEKNRLTRQAISVLEWVVKEGMALKFKI